MVKICPNILPNLFYLILLLKERYPTHKKNDSSNNQGQKFEPEQLKK